MNALDDRREAEEAASHTRDLERWLAASEPLAIDDDSDWIELTTSTPAPDDRQA
jgi:hypothetical protein